MALINTNSVTNSNPNINPDNDANPRPNHARWVQASPNADCTAVKCGGGEVPVALGSGWGRVRVRVRFRVRVGLGLGLGTVLV